MDNLFPPSESWSRRVSLESRYGICTTFSDVVGVVNAHITLPSAN